MSKCEVEDCDRNAVSKKICTKHYYRLKNFGGFDLPKPIELFERHYMPVTETGCWIWIGGVNHKGYGSCKGLHGKTASAHRTSWELHIGEIPSGLFVLHRCDVPSCVNPDHLFLGTAKDNTMDMMAKGRHVTKRGSDCWRSKLTESQVLYIRSLEKPLPAAKLAKKYGIGTEALYQVYNRKVWRHV